MTNEPPDQEQAATDLSSPDTVDSSGVLRPQVPQVDQTMKGDCNQAIGRMSGGTAMGNVQGAVFNISGSNITNLTGSGDIYYQEAHHQPTILGNGARVAEEPQLVKTILVLAANPKGTPLRLGEEVRSLQIGLALCRQSRYSL